MKIFQKLIEACVPSENQKARNFLLKAGFMEYMTNRWRKNFVGQITIFCVLDKDIEFSANFNIQTQDGIQKQGSIAPIKSSAQEYEDGLKEIVDMLQEEIK